MSTALKLSKLELWPTVVWGCELPDHVSHNATMIEALEQERLRDPAGPPERSNPNDWQSRKSLQDLPAFRPLMELVVQLVMGPIQQHYRWDTRDRTPKIECFGNFNGPGGFHRLHNHAGSLVSGVYYCHVPENCGNIRLHNPHKLMQVNVEPPLMGDAGNAASVFYTSIQPQVGRMYLFPGWLAHEVEPNRSNAERVSIAFNVSLAPKGAASGIRSGDAQSGASSSGKRLSRRERRARRGETS